MTKAIAILKSLAIWLIYIIFSGISALLVGSVATFGIFIVILLGVHIYLNRISPKIEKNVLTYQPTTALLYGGILFFGIMFIIPIIIQYMVDMTYIVQLLALLSQPYPILVLTVALFAPAVEELVYRSSIHRVLRGKVSYITVCIISTILFTLSHGTLTHVIPMSILGFYLAVLYEYTNNIYINILMHSAYNVLNLVFPAISSTLWVAMLLTVGGILLVCEFGKQIPKVRNMMITEQLATKV